MKTQRASPRGMLRFGWILMLLVGCGTYNPTPGGTVAPQPATEPPTITTSPGESPVPGDSTGTSSITGSVQIEDGHCCVGGAAGSSIQVTVQFSATSPSGKVSSMRVKPGYSTCAAQPSVESATWEPFVSSKSYPVLVGINWNTFSLSAQFQDDHGNLSPIYCDDIGVEGSPAVPIVNPTDWYPQIQCFSENDVHPSQGEVVTDSPTTFRWPDKNQLPDGVFFKVNVYSAADQYTALIATGQTRDTSISLEIPPDRAGDIVWYITLVDANGAFLDHGRCSSFSPSLLTVNPPSGIKGVHFTYRP